MALSPPANTPHTFAAMMSCLTTRKMRPLPFRSKDQGSNLGAGIGNIVVLPSQAGIDVG